MKKIIFIVCLLITMYAFAQTDKSAAIAAENINASDVPASLLTDDPTYWTTSTLSALGYVNKSAGPEYSNYKDTDGMVAKLKFKKDNRFEFLSYVQANSYGAETETMMQIEGSITFIRDDKGQNIFITKADKGVRHIIKDGKKTTRTIRQNELKSQHSNSYLWEKINFPGDVHRTYLLVVNLDEHPNANVKVPGSIDRSWVSKFHIPSGK